MTSVYQHLCFIGLGSNLGSREEYIRKAIEGIHLDEKNKITKISSLYESKPFGGAKQENYINAVIKVITEYSIYDLLKSLKELEYKLGRTLGNKWDSREIDLDILYYDDVILNDENLEVPHPRIAERDFVLIPLCEIEPEHIHPALNKKNRDICSNNNELYVFGKIPKQIILKDGYVTLK